MPLHVRSMQCAQGEREHGVQGAQALSVGNANEKESWVTWMAKLIYDNCQDSLLKNKFELTGGQA